MPTYEYRCTACGHAFETMHGMTAPVLRKCPKCGRLKLERLISGGAGVIFKGSGFYETDYKRNRSGGDPVKAREKSEAAEKSETKAETKPEPKAETRSESKGESKPATKSDAKPKKDSGSKKD